MKHMSVAEQTLKKQIASFQKQFDELYIAATKIKTEMEVLETVIGQLNDEKIKLEQYRIATSASRKGTQTA